MTYIKCSIIVTIILFLLAAFVTPSNAYTMRFLDTPPGSSSEPRAINDSGQVVGEIWGAVPTVAVWDSNGHLSTPISGTAWAYDISNNGVIVGDSAGLDGYSHPYMWSAETGFTDLTTDLSTMLHVWRINAGGQIGGHDDLTSPTSRVFVWDQTSGLTYLPAETYHGAWFTGISDSGTVTGVVQVQDKSTRAFVWSAQNGLTLLMPDVPWNGALDISSGGTVLGGVDVSEGVWQTFLWKAGIGIIPAWTGGPSTPYHANAVNDEGLVVGTFLTQEKAEKAFVWDAQTGFTILGDGRALDINNEGWILGWDGTNAVVWQPEPVPEPSSLMALTVSLLPLGRMAFRKRKV